MSRRPPALDLAIAAVLTVTTQIELWAKSSRVEDPFAVQVAAFALMTVPLAWRRTAPAAATAVVSLGFALQVMLAGDAPVLGGLLAAIVITYSAGAYTRGREAAAAALFLFFGLIAAVFVDADKRSLEDALGNIVIFSVIWGLGRAIWARQARAASLEQAVEEQSLRADHAAADERARIARELHDVVAQNVSVMVLQAGAARQVLGADVGQAAAPLGAIEETGRQAVDELRRLLGILRADDGPLALAPQPGIADLERLAAELAAGGLQVDLEISGAVRPLPPGLELSAYRIVQEALTNVIKHAKAASARVRLTLGEEELEIEVLDEGGHAAGGPSGGHGIVGMRERAALYGGRLEAGPRAGRGFRVAAWLPIPGAAP